MIENVSFIIIARNESFVLTKCLNSIKAMKFKDCEVICVDSDSTDDTLQIMKRYIDKIDNLRIIRCSGLVNAAIARNAGLKNAHKKYVYFVDGDIELNPEFITSAIKKIASGTADAVTGKLNEVIYNADNNREIKRWVRRKFITEEKRCVMTGGIFLAHKKLIDRIGEWDITFIRGQDLEYTLRISRNGTLIQIPEFIGTHHTHQFHDRSWEHYKKGYPLLYGKLIYKSLSSPQLTFSVLRRNRGLATFLIFILLIAGGFTMANTGLIQMITMSYLLIACLAIDMAYSTVIKKWRISQWLLHNYLTPPLILLGIFYHKKSDPDTKTTLETIH